MHTRTVILRAQRLVAGGLALAVLSASAPAQEQVSRLVQYIKDGPSLYRTPEAVQYYAGKGATSPSASAQAGADRDAAAKSIRAAILLAGMGAAAKEAVATLIDVFPRAEHVSVITGAHFGPGMGGFDDWTQTYAINEKSKFILSSQFIEYENLSKCDDFITSVPDREVAQKRTGKGGAVVEATANIHVIITVNAAAYALTAITGQTPGADRAAWQNWWALNSAQYPSSSQPSAAAAPADQGSRPAGGVTRGSGGDIVEKARYRIVLATGDELVGRVESIADTTITFETDDGKPYSFAVRLVVEHELLEMPRKADAAREGDTLTYDELTRRSPTGLRIQVRLQSGSTFVGTLSRIDAQAIRMNIDGSEIPIAKNAVALITTVTGGKQPAPPSKAIEKPAGPPDTLVIKNPQTDDYGKSLPDIVLSGQIVGDDGHAIQFQTTDNARKSFSYAQIARRIDHDTRDGFSDIERYGKQLFCPAGMILVDVPPGKPGHPFLKACIDKYEYPNQKDAVPRTNVSFDEARALCEGQGKRLCTSDEWRFACGGLEEYAYPYGWNFEKETCNSQVQGQPEPSGQRYKCVSKFGAGDMAGNVFEWVVGNDKQPYAMGGPLSKCQAMSPGAGGTAKPQTGLRCCKSN